MDALDPKNHRRLPILNIGDELVVNGNLVKISGMYSSAEGMGTVVACSRTVPAGVGNEPIRVEFRGEL